MFCLPVKAIFINWCHFTVHVSRFLYLLRESCLLTGLYIVNKCNFLTPCYQRPGVRSFFARPFITSFMSRFLSTPFLQVLAYAVNILYDVNLSFRNHITTESYVTYSISPNIKPGSSTEIAAQKCRSCPASQTLTLFPVTFQHQATYWQIMSNKTRCSLVLSHSQFQWKI